HQYFDFCEEWVEPERARLSGRGIYVVYDCIADGRGPDDGDQLHPRAPLHAAGIVQVRLMGTMFLQVVDATVVLADLRDFSPLATQLGPVELGLALSRFYEHVG